MKKCITILTMIVFAMIATQTFAGLVDGDFQNDSLANDAAANVTPDVGLGWRQAFNQVVLASNPPNSDVWVDASAPAPALRYIGQVFDSSGLSGTQLVRFQYDLSSLGGTPNYADNYINIQIWGTDQAAQPNNTSLVLNNGTVTTLANWNTVALLDETFYDTSATAGYVTKNTSGVFDPSAYSYYGIIVTIANIADGGGQPGQEQLKFDNVELVPIPEPALLGLLGLGILALIRRK